MIGRFFSVLFYVPMWLAGTCTGVHTYSVPRDTDIRTVVTGTWDWEKNDSTWCSENPHTIAFADSGKVMILTHRKAFEGVDGKLDSITRYDVRATSRSRIEAFIPGETRRTDDGDLVVWNLVLNSKDRYAWHSTVWPAWSRTGSISRCPRTLPRTGERDGAR